MQSEQCHHHDRDAERRVKRPRFHIEKLEERIAPSHKAGHHPPGQNKVCYWVGWGGYKYPCQ